MSERVTIERRDHLLLMGLNRPHKYNAADTQMLRELSAAYGELGGDDELRVGVLHAHGDHFCSGLDLTEVWPRLKEVGPEVLGGGGAYDPLGIWGERVPKPVVMAVQGIAYTLAIELALACDIVIAAEGVRFRQLEVGRGIIPFGGGTFRAPLRLGWGNAMRFLLTAEEFGAEEALRIGLVQQVVPLGEQLEEAVRVAGTIAAQAPGAVQASLANSRAALVEAERAAARDLKEALPRVLDSSEAREGLRSFVERRPARFE